MKHKAFFQTALSLGAVLAAAACGVLRTDGANPAQVAASARETAQRYDINEAWWGAYQDSRLNGLIGQAFENNIDLKKAAVNVNRALYEANILGANLVPAFNASLGASNSKNLKNGAYGQSFSSQLGLSYEIDLWRKLNAQADAQVWEHQATLQDLASARLTLANNVADAYFNIAYLNEAIALAEKSLRQYQSIDRIAAAKHQYGKTDASEPRQARQSLLSARNSLAQLEGSREALEETLRNLLNLRPGQNMAAAPAAFKLPAAKGVDLDVPVAALANRPDLRAAEYRLKSSLKGVDAQKRSWYPSITVGATLSTASDKAKTAFNVPFLGGSVKLNLPFLNWNTLKWEGKKAEAAFTTARLNFEQTLTAALNEVFGNHQKYARATENLQTLSQKYALDQKNSRYYEVRYRHGKNELKDWLAALNTEYASAQSLLNQRYEVLKYENMVYKAMAGRYTPKKKSGFQP